MHTEDLRGLSWICTTGSLTGLPPALVPGRRVRPSRLEHEAVRVACTGRTTDHVYFVESNGWTWAFGHQLGLGGLGGKLSRARGVAMSFHADAKYDAWLARLSRDGQVLREVSFIQRDFTQSGDPLADEPQLHAELDAERLARLSRAWGADVTQLQWGAPCAIGKPGLGRLMPFALGLVPAALLVAAFALRGCPPSARQRCLSECVRAAREFAGRSPLCAGIAPDDCAFAREDANLCKETCR